MHILFHSFDSLVVVSNLTFLMLKMNETLVLLQEQLEEAQNKLKLQEEKQIKIAFAVKKERELHSAQVAQLAEQNTQLNRLLEIHQNKVKELEILIEDQMELKKELKLALERAKKVEEDSEKKLTTYKEKVNQLISQHNAHSNAMNGVDR